MITLKISKRVQLSLYSIVAISLITGVLFFVLKTWFDVEGDFGLEKHPWQFPVLKIHAASAFGMMLFSGAMLASHVQFGWRSQRSRKTGITLISIFSIQILSAYLLYYLANETARIITEYIHLAVGVSIPLALFAHIVLARAR